MDKIRIYIALLFCQAISFILPVQAQDNTGSDSNWYNPYGGLMANSTNGRWHVMDPLCEKYYDVSPYAYCNGNPISQFDPDGRAIETVWDIGNVMYDVGATIYNHVKGYHETAKSHWVDAGLDAVASLAPFIPAGSSKLFRGGSNAVKAFQCNIKTGKNLKKQ